MQTSLAVARDRAVGVLLGLLMMWLVFDQLWGVSAGAGMKKTFVSTLRLLAQLLREPLPGGGRPTIDRIYSLRETINASFDQARALADGVLFEFGASRQRDLALRSLLRRFQPQLRTLFVTRIALLKYRLRLPGFELPEDVEAAQVEFDERIGRMLDGLAARIEGEEVMREETEDSFERLERTVRSCCLAGAHGPLTAEVQTFLDLSRNVEDVTTMLDREIGSGM